MSITQLKATWDPVVASWLEGGRSYTPELEPWLRSYTGRGDCAVVEEALPEPWLGDLGRTPAMTFLALNPGQPFLGRGETWRGGQPMPDLQSARGVFAGEIRTAGSYSAWAARFPDWPRWAPSPNTFFTSRARFARDWLQQPGLALDDCVNAEIYPWHSYKFNKAAFRPGPAAKDLIDRLLLASIEETGCRYVFGFGAVWADLLPVLGFEETYRLSTRDGHTWPGAPKDRVISVFARGGMKVVSEFHSGGAGPPKTAEVSPLRDLLEPHL